MYTRVTDTEKILIRGDKENSDLSILLTQVYGSRLLDMQYIKDLYIRDKIFSEKILIVLNFFITASICVSFIGIMNSYYSFITKTRKTNAILRIVSGNIDHVCNIYRNEYITILLISGVLSIVSFILEWLLFPHISRALLGIQINITPNFSYLTLVLVMVVCLGIASFIFHKKDIEKLDVITELKN